MLSNTTVRCNKFIDAGSAKAVVISDSLVQTRERVTVESFRNIVPNFFGSSDNIVPKAGGVDYLSLVGDYEAIDIWKKNSFFVASPTVSLTDSIIESALVNVVADQVSVQHSRVSASFETKSESLQTLSYFEDICGENGGNNFNLGGLALPKHFDSRPGQAQLSDADQDRIKMCKFKSIASESMLSYSSLLDLIKTGNTGTVSRQVPGSIRTAGVVSVLANSVSVSADSAVLASVKQESPQEHFGSPSGGSAIFVTSHFDFQGTLSVEGVDSPVFYNGAGSGGNIFIFDPLWAQKPPSRLSAGASQWKLQMSGGTRPDAPVGGLENKFFRAEHGMVYTSFCPSGTSSISCAVCPQGWLTRPEKRVFPKLRLRTLSAVFEAAVLRGQPVS